MVSRIPTQSTGAAQDYAFFAKDLPAKRRRENLTKYCLWLWPGGQGKVWLLAGASGEPSRAWSAPAGRVEPSISRGAQHLHLQASWLHPNTREHGECVASVPAEVVSQPSFQSHTRLASQIFKAAAPSLKISHSVLQSEGFPVPKEAPPRQPSLIGPDARRLAPYQALLILQPPLCRLTSLPTSPLCVWGRGGRDSGLWCAPARGGSSLWSQGTWLPGPA